MTTARPTLHWVLPPDRDGADVQICRDRACTMELTRFVAVGDHGAPPVALPVGSVFWRVFGRSHGVEDPTVGATWQFTVGHGAGTRVDTSWGTTLDVNGDGLPDILVGAPNLGRAYLYHGAPGGIPTDPTLTLTGSGGHFGHSVASAGDLDGDGFGDLVISAPDALGAGRVYVYSGGPMGVSPTPTTLDALRGNGFGWDVASAGDVDGDGYGDLLVGAYGAPPGGEAYVFHGSPRGVVATNPITLRGSNAGVNFGVSVASAGDVNGDGSGDIVVGADHDGLGGTVTLFLGGAGGPSIANSLVISNPADSVGRFGSSVASGGDVNGDGLAELVVGDADINTGTGAAYLYYGRADAIHTLPDRTFIGPDGSSAAFGDHAIGVGDLNADGFGDLVITADGCDQVTCGGPGWVHVYLGGIRGPATTADMTLVGTDLVSNNFGDSAGAVGDVNGDGFDDVLVGAHVEAIDHGRAYLFLGSATGVVVMPSLTLSGPAGAAFGAAVASVITANDSSARGGHAVAACVVKSPA